MTEKKYPMTYEEYKKRVIELFLDTGDFATKEEKLEFLNEELLKKDPDFIRNLYEEDCANYDDFEGQGITDSEYIFSDEILLSQPVRVLVMVM